MTDQLLVQRQDGHLALRFNRPAQRNAINVAMYAALADAIEAAGTDGTRLITLSGEGVDFTAGNDIADFLAAGIPAPGEDIPVWRLLRALANNVVPLVAAVQGNAVGIGTTILLHCDLVIAERGARFVMPFVDLGLVPEAASSLILPQLCGRRGAAKSLLLGEPFGADEALAMGIASHVTEAGTAATALDEMAARLLAKPAQALRQTQRLLRGQDVAPILRRMEEENHAFSERLQSDEARAAFAAFLARRG